MRVAHAKESEKMLGPSVGMTLWKQKIQRKRRHRDTLKDKYKINGKENFIREKKTKNCSTVHCKKMIHGNGK